VASVLLQTDVVAVDVVGVELVDRVRVLPVLLHVAEGVRCEETTLLSYFGSL